MANDPLRRLLYHCPQTTGGLAAYAHEQARALARAGCAVTLVTRSDYSRPTDAAYEIVRLHPAPPVARRSLPRILRRLRTLVTVLREQYRFAAYVEQHDFRRVLMGSYIEYAAPLWAWRFRLLARRGHIFGAIVHDPVRNYVVGPLWWHRQSIACGYSFVREAFVHAPVVLDTVRPRPSLRTTVIPQGPYRFPPSTEPRAAVRQALNLPSDALVLLAFGHVRAQKNLHLVIEALATFPDVYLVVAGEEQSDSRGLSSLYQDEARRHDVADRCRWLLRYIPDEKVGALFEAADLIVLTYSRTFRSASAVLNTALRFRKPCLASSGEGNLKQVVREYGLGIWVEPDDAEAIRTGLGRLRTSQLVPRWEDYERDHCWETNAALVLDRLLSA